MAARGREVCGPRALDRFLDSNQDAESPSATAAAGIEAGEHDRHDGRHGADA